MTIMFAKGIYLNLYINVYLLEINCFLSELIAHSFKHYQMFQSI